MNARDILPLRLSNQRLATPQFRTPLEVVAWLGAVQSQDYPAARWGLGLRATGVLDADVEAAFEHESTPIRKRGRGRGRGALRPIHESAGDTVDESNPVK